MQPRPRMPYHGGGMQGGFHHPMYGRPQMPMQPMMGQAPNMRPFGNVPRPRQGGGLLSRILGGGNQARGMGGGNIFGPAAAGNSGGGLLKSFTNPSGIVGFLQNTQKVLSTAQQIGPMVQQYGPLVKNLPAMWRLYKGLKDAPADENHNNVESSDVEDKKITSKSTKGAVQQDHDDIESESKSKSTDTRKKSTKGASVPRLYI